MVLKGSCIPTAVKALLCGLLFSSPVTSAAAARDYVLAVGSSTVFPFATAVAEHLGRTSPLKPPQIEAWGTGGGIKLFCRGIGADEMDVALVSRKITAVELARCQDNGVGEILELRFGRDGITLATHKDVSLDLTLRSLYLALARKVPDPRTSEALITNPYQRWNQIDPDLPDMPIKVYGPPLTSGTRDMLAEQGLIPGCRTFSWLEAMEDEAPDRFQTVCGTLREDGGYVTTGENDNLMVRKVAASPEAVGIFGFSYYDQNRNLLQAARIEGVSPSFESIDADIYPLSRPLAVYVKVAHLPWIAGLRPFLEALVSAQAAGQEGYLTELGLVPLSEEERTANARLLEATNPNLPALSE